MDNPVEELRILMLEDTPADAELAEITLRRAGLAFTALRVDTREAFERGLDEFKPNIVLADYALPNYDGREALEYSRRTHPHIPVVMLTGAMGNESAVELLKLGARDYVLKSELARLAPAISRAMLEEQGIRNRKLDEQLRQESEMRYRRLFEAARDGILVLDAETGRIVDANPFILDLLSYSRDECIGKMLWEIGLFADAEASKKAFEELQTKGSIRYEDLPLETKGGHRREVEFISNVYEVEGRKVIQCNIRDITERKYAENALKRANRALKTLSAGNLVLVRAESEDELLREAVKVIVETGGYKLAVVDYAMDDPGKGILPKVWHGFKESSYWAEHMTWADTELGQLPISKAMRSGTTQICHSIADDPAFKPWREAALQRGYVSNIALPLSGGGKIFGVLSIYSSEIAAFNDEEEVRLLEELANDLAYGITTLRARTDHEQHAKVLRQSLEQSIQTIAGTLEARDPYTAGHQRRVSELAVVIAQELGLSHDQINGIHLAAIIHDLGKIYVPAEILSKPGRLSDIEYSLIKTHPQIGYDILKDVKFPWPIADIVLQHHEKLDGSGYPQGLKNGQILLESRIMTVADVVEAMSTHRPYRPSLGVEVALGAIKQGRGTMFDPEVVDACTGVFANNGFAFSSSPRHGGGVSQQE